MKRTIFVVFLLFTFCFALPAYSETGKKANATKKKRK